MSNCTHSLLFWNFTPHDLNEIREAFEDEILEFVRVVVMYSHIDSESRPFMLKLNLKPIHQRPYKYAFNIMCHISSINK